MDDLFGKKKAPPPPPDVLYEERGVLVLNKSAGILTQAPPGIESVESNARRWLKSRDEKPGKIYLSVTHRLDRPVSGAIVLAKNVRAAKRIQEQFRNRTVSKTYMAIVSGEAPESGTWTDYMRKIPDEPRSEIVPENHQDAKKAILHFERVDFKLGQSLVKIRLETGRTHQIRLQFQHHGFPILGDEQYHSTKKFGPPCQDLRKRAIALHALQIVFEHPIQHETVDLTAPFPDYWRNDLPFDVS